MKMLNETEQKKTTPNIIITLLKTSDKEKNLESSQRGEKKIHQIQMTSCQKFYKPEDKVISFYNLKRKIIYQHRVLYLGKVSFRNEGRVNRELISNRPALILTSA